MNNTHQALGEYSLAIHAYEAAAATLIANLKTVQAKAAAVPGGAHDEATRKAIADLTAAAHLKLSDKYPDVVAAAKAVRA